MVKRIIGLVLLAFSIIVLLLPGVRVVTVLCDPAIKSGDIPDIAWSMHHTLAPRYEDWAQQWVNSGVGDQLDTGEVAKTEWPLFGSCFFLWATEALHDHHAAAGREDPMIYARGAVDAATKLVLDPRSAGWVREYWGETYLTKENVFYRMLVMSAIISHHRLTGATEHLPQLRRQVEGLAAEIDASATGLLDDYPHQCYPTDVAAALAAIKRADAVLGTDHSALTQRALRGFTGPRVRNPGLPPYAADAKSGAPYDRSRGCGNSYLTMHAPFLWPEQAKRWYALYEEHFWQRDWIAAGFREYPKGAGDLASGDVDSGPILLGRGFAASAFGLAAARVNGRFDHAHPLTAMMIALSVPMVDGTLWLPRRLSSMSDAPYLGESAILYCLTRTPVVAETTPSNGGMTGVVWLALAVYLGIGFLIFCWGWRWAIGRKRRKMCKVQAVAPE